jgi:hypothetical protein
VRILGVAPDDQRHFRMRAPHVGVGLLIDDEEALLADVLKQTVGRLARVHALH